ncbi:MAG: PA2169 family four-helix-bundle protein, partial [Myxococcota bacterium]
EEPNDRGTTMGSVHQMWMKFRAALNGGDPEVVLIEATRGEERMKELYEDLLEDHPGSALSDVLHHQYAQILKDLATVKQLRERND